MNFKGKNNSLIGKTFISRSRKRPDCGNTQAYIK